MFIFYIDQIGGGEMLCVAWGLGFVLLSRKLSLSAIFQGNKIQFNPLDTKENI